MTNAVRIGVLLLLVLAASVAGAWWWQRDVAAAGPQSREQHTFLHINCKNHNHGPAWHKNHGRTFRGGANSE